MKKQFSSLGLVLLLSVSGTGVYAAADELPLACSTDDFCPQQHFRYISGNQLRLRRVHEDQAYREACLKTSTGTVTCLSKQLEETFGLYTEQRRNEFANQEVTCFPGAPCAFKTTRRGLSWIASALCCSAATLASGGSCSLECACCCAVLTAAPRVLHIAKILSIKPFSAVPEFQQELAKRKANPQRFLNFLPEKTMDFGEDGEHFLDADPFAFLHEKSIDLK